MKINKHLVVPRMNCRMECRDGREDPLPGGKPALDSGGWRKGFSSIAVLPAAARPEPE